MNKKGLAFAAVQAAIIAAVLLVVSLPIGSLRTTIPQPPANCDGGQELWGPGYAYWGYNETSSSVPTLVMRPRQTGFVCVIYRSEPSGGTYLGAVQFERFLGTFAVFSSSCKIDSQGGISCHNTESQSFRVSGYVSNSTTPFVDNSTAFYYGAVYSVTALGNATGFYTASAPRPGCGGFPLAVGYSASQLNATDFLGFFKTTLCINGPFAPVQVGVIGIPVTMLDFPGN